MFWENNIVFLCSCAFANLSKKKNECKEWAQGQIAKDFNDRTTHILQLVSVYGLQKYV